MDLLGSILGSMSAPPSLSDKEKERRKKEREMANKAEENRRKMTKLFREKIEKKINEFMVSGMGKYAVLRFKSL